MAKKTKPPAKAKPSTLGNNIRKARTKAKITQLALAHKIGHTGEDAGAYISRLENGVYEPRLDTIRSIAKALNVSLDVLLKK